ncbi:MAG: hypothetical protein ACF8PG_14785 [Maioricimonas sp. JB045]
MTSGATIPAAEQTAQAPAASQERGGALAGIAATVLLIGVAGVAMWLRTDHIAEASYWFDESSSWKTISFGWGEMFTPITRNVHPPFFYLALKSWATLFGDAPVSLRMFSATFGVLTVLAAYWLTLEILANIGSLQGDSSRAAGRRLSAGVCAAALLAVSAMQVQAGLNARMYTLGTFLAVVCATHVLRAARTGGTVRDWAVASVTGTMLTLTHYYGLFTAAALGLFLLGSFVFTLWRQGWCGTTKRLAAGMGASAWLAANVWGLWLPYFEAQRGQVTDSYWTPSFNWEQLARTCTVMLSSKEWYGPFGEWMWWVVWLCGLVSLLLFLWGGRGGRLVALAVVVPFVVSIAYSLQGRSVFVLRYFTFAQVFLLIGWAVLTARIRWWFPRVAIQIASIAWLGYWTYGMLETRAWQCERSQLKDVADVLEEWRDDSETVIVGTAVVHPTVLHYSANRQNIFVFDRGRPYPHYQGSPLLRDSEPLSVQELEESGVDRVYIVDVYDLYRKGSRFEVRLPDEWKQVRQRWFEERHGQPLRVFLREYRREPPGGGSA